jgi:hypothetical protein
VITEAGEHRVDWRERLEQKHPGASSRVRHRPKVRRNTVGESFDQGVYARLLAAHGGISAHRRERSKRRNSSMLVGSMNPRDLR